MFRGLTSVAIIFILLAVGFFFAWKKRWPEETTRVFSVVVVQIAAPCLAVVSISDRFTREMLGESAWNLLLVVIMYVILYFLGGLLAKIMKLPPKKTAVFRVTFMFNNTIFIGLPINQIVFGNDGLPYLFTVFIVSITLFWSIGAYTLEKASDHVGKGGFSLKKIISPGFIGVIIGVVLVLTGLELPEVLHSALSYLGDVCVPLSLLFIGASLAASVRKGFGRITVDQLVIMAGKFIISPLIMCLLLRAGGVDGFAFNVLVFTAAMPCHAQTAIMAGFYDVEPEYASKLVSLSTILSLIAIPVYAGLLG
ncbi:MAG: AEC family transporter [Firmicutes bacterium]|nr:AEC family transporter [Bacillota bacterium]